MISKTRKYDLFFKKSEQTGKKINDDDEINRLRRELNWKKTHLHKKECKEAKGKNASKEIKFPLESGKDRANKQKIKSVM